jgi:hypothetical protein
MKLRTNAIIYGISCIGALYLLIVGFINSNFFYIVVSVFSISMGASLFILCIKMIGKIYCYENEIIREYFGRKIKNSIDKNLKIRYGVCSIKIMNQHNLYLDKENDDNNVIENIYTYIENNSINNSIIFPFIYKRNNSTTSLMYLLLAIIGFGVLIILNKYYMLIILNISIIFLSIMFMGASITIFLANKKVIFEKDKIIISNAINRESMIHVNAINKIEINISLKKLYMHFFYNNKKFIIDINSKASFEDIEKMYLLKRYYDGILENNGHFA